MVEKKKNHILSFIDWDSPDCMARYMRVRRVVLGEKKNLTLVERDFRWHLRMVKELLNEL